jgi:aromatic ring-opening dioxygenase catalytic subunit (LigB family)
MTSRLPVLFLSHGGGPWPYVEGLRQQYAHTEQELRGLAGRLPARPTALLMISSHWEAPRFSVATGARPPMEYDYGGFPANTYQIRYPASGEPELAERVRERIAATGIEVATDAGKGFDHGVFVPLSLLYPKADVPIVMMSIKSGYGPAEHLAVGQALAPLRDEGVLIVGSGLTYHNMRGFNSDAATADAEAFTAYLDEAVSLEDARARDERLLHWDRAPRARLAHPREDHLISLLVVAGAAGEDRGRVLFSETVMKVPMTSYVFGELR